MSSITSLVSSRVDFLNSLKVSPKARPISGSFLGPKMIKARTSIKINPGTPIFENKVSSPSGEKLLSAYIIVQILFRLLSLENCSKIIHRFNMIPLSIVSEPCLFFNLNQ